MVDVETDAVETCIRLVVFVTVRVYVADQYVILSEGCDATPRRSSQAAIQPREALSASCHARCGVFARATE